MGGRGSVTSSFFYLLVAVLCSLLLVGCDSGEVEPTSGEPERLSGQVAPESDLSLALEPAQLEWVGQRIFQNECSGHLQCLVHWNEGESFPSLGIGHFIWYPAGVNERFVESFPQLIAYMNQRQAPVPGWLRSLDPLDAPWPDRSAFMRVQDSARVTELREFLAVTQGVQAEFIFLRTQASLGNVLEEIPSHSRDAIRQYLTALSATPGGVYALMDYVNFKGEGLAESERYQE